MGLNGSAQEFLGAMGAAAPHLYLLSRHLLYRNAFHSTARRHQIVVRTDPRCGRKGSSHPAIAGRPHTWTWTNSILSTTRAAAALATITAPVGACCRSRLSRRQPCTRLALTPFANATLAIDTPGGYRALNTVPPPRIGCR